MKRFGYCLSSLLLAIAFVFPARSFAQRVEGPIVFYTFETAEGGNVIRDVSGVEPIIDLTMSEEVTKLEGRNGVNIKDDDDSFQEGLYADGPSPALAEKIMASGAFTIEAWLAPIHDQLGECRVFTYSQSSGSRNFTLLVKLENTEMRLRTATNGNNGFNMAWLTGPIITEVPPPAFHLVWTFEGGEEHVYLDGEVLDSRSILDGDLSGWDDSHQVIIGTEHGNNAVRRQYKGDIYMVAVYDKALTSAEVGQNFVAGSGPPTPGAHSPMPENNATDVSRDVVLGWTPGTNPQSNNVYLGTALSDIALASEGQVANSYDPGRLDFDQAYFWRVDEVSDAEVAEGTVWSFSTEPISYPITAVTATSATGSFGASLPEKTIDGSGLSDDLHGTDPSDMWISSAIPATIEYAFDRAYKLDELWIWNSNQAIERFVGFGGNEVVIEHSLDGENWTILEGVPPLAQAPGSEGYAHGNTIDFGGVTAQYVRIAVNSVHGFSQQASLSEVRFYFIPTYATRPSPEDGATGVASDVALSWGRDGREADVHDVYVGSDADSLELAERVTGSSLDTSSLDFQLGESYVWRVDEVNETMDPSVWTGTVWAFTVSDVVVVDDFEGYEAKSADDPSAIFNVWVDGFGDDNNGALVGNDTPPYAERGTAMGRQSMPFLYGQGATASSATRTFASQDWTRAGAQSLSLSFHGTEGNTGQLYVTVNGTRIDYDGDAANLALADWTTWTIDLSGVGSRQDVSSLTIGVDNGSGLLFFDDVVLHR